jgi:hypothetical protein
MGESEAPAGDPVRAGSSDILIERDGTITFVSLYAELLPVALALADEEGKRPPSDGAPYS